MNTATPPTGSGGGSSISADAQPSAQLNWYKVAPGSPCCRAAFNAANVQGALEPEVGSSSVVDVVVRVADVSVGEVVVVYLTGTRAALGADLGVEHAAKVTANAAQRSSVFPCRRARLRKFIDPSCPTS
jgi:hypothetical protein